MIGHHVHMWIPNRATGVVRTVPMPRAPMAADVLRWQWPRLAVGAALCDADERACSGPRCAECDGAPRLHCPVCPPWATTRRNGPPCRHCDGFRTWHCHTCPAPDRCEVGPCAVRCRPLEES